MGGRRRTTASLTELPITVQYAVQVSYQSVGQSDDMSNCS
jgi:hypothetical protein